MGWSERELPNVSGFAYCYLYDHLVSGLRTPAIAESAIRSAGIALIEANGAKAKQSSQEFMRSLLAAELLD